MEDWAEIRGLYRAEGLVIRAIARRLGVLKNTVKKAVACHEPPRYERAPRGSAVDGFEPAIRALLAEFLDMPTSVMVERVGWARGRSVFYERVAMLRPLFQPVDPASRTEYQAGELAQCDLWFPPVDVPLGFGHLGRPPVLVMVSGYSQMIIATMILTRQSPDLLAGHWALIYRWGRVLRALVWDNESAVGKWRGGTPQLTEAMNVFRGVLGVKVVLCRPGDPQAKGLVERANGYLETSFLPGRIFSSPDDFNTQLVEWLVKANQRQHRRLQCRPVDRWEADRAAMLELPPVDPVIGWRSSTRLPRDHYVCLDTNDYSVHPSVIGRRVQVWADLQRVVITAGSVEVGPHQRCWAGHQTITDPDHAAAGAELRRSRRLVRVPAIDTEVQRRPLSDYDRLFTTGIDGSDEEIA